MPPTLGASSTIHDHYLKLVRNGTFEKMLKIARDEYISSNPDENIWYAIDTSSRKAPLAKFSGNNPTDRAKKGIKHIAVVDRNGEALYVDIAPANTHDSKLLEPILSQISHKENLQILTADSAFDVKKLVQKCKEKNIILFASTNPRRRKNVTIYHPRHP